MLRRHCHRLLACGLFLVGALAGVAAAAPPIQMELVSEDGFSPTDSQKWVQFLSRAGITSIRIQRARGGETASITNRGTAQRPNYQVVGILTDRNRLIVPGGQFGLSDREAVQAWLKKIESDGESGPTQQTVAFGLTPEHLVAFHEKLAPVIGCPSRGRRCGDVARDIVQGIQLEFTVTEAARRAFTTAETCPDDLTGLASGTALAAAIRPLGLVLRPEKQGRSARLWIGQLQETEEAWPVGWPSEEAPGKVAPKLFETLTADISNVPLGKVLDALQGKVGLPFLLDHNDLARREIDLAEVRVTYPPGKATYKRVLDKILFQGKLNSELRVDEAGRPFLWIAPR